MEQQYVTLKKSNPDFPILIRECSGVQARLWARYGESDRHWFYLEVRSVGFTARFGSGNSCFSKDETRTTEKVYYEAFQLGEKSDLGQQNQFRLVHTLV